MKKKLIEVALPLESINAEAAKEKSIRHGHPSTMHLWWARRPLAACRAVLFASLVDDPSSHPDRFPTDEAQEAERQRLFKLIERLVKWENIGDEDLYAEAYEEILKSTGGNPPPVLDPFAGGGSIPLEAQRLGLEAHASDLNPVAVLINKALIEIPPRFAGKPPANPDSRQKLDFATTYKGAAGLAEDVKYYGDWMKEQAQKRVGHLYPKAKMPGGGEATVIAWIWARTVKCPNPACGAEMPLVSSYWLSKKKGKEAWLNPIIDYKNKSIRFEVRTEEGEPPKPPKVARGAKFRCEVCGQIAPDQHIKDEGAAGRMGSKMLAIIADGKKGRIYLPVDDTHIATTLINKPDTVIEQQLPYDPKNIWCVPYGLTKYKDLFTPRQLTTLNTFNDLVAEAIAKAQTDAVVAGLPEDGIGLDAGGCGAKAYGEAIGVYLAFCLDKETDYSSSLCSWNISRDGLRNTFARQALPMIWDFAETNPFSNQSGCWNNCVEWVVKCLRYLTPNSKGYAIQQDAMKMRNQGSIVISTDPPYYDNIGYADLSDYFYIWLRRSLKKVYPKLFSTMLVPKTEELVATPYRFEGNYEKARDFFEYGMLKAFSKMYETASRNYPVTVYYAFKQSENNDEVTNNSNGSKVASTGWETMLSALIRAGFTITGTWPTRTERPGRTVSIETNALASSIALVCRPRPEDAPSTTRRAFLAELREALKNGLHNLQSGNIAPVDLAQASIGPGMAVYSKYAEVLEANGEPMSVRSALVLINQELDAYLSAQEGSMDTESRFCIAWFEQYGLSSGKFGDADTLARAKMAHLQELVDDGVLEAARGVVRLKRRDELPEKWDALREKTVWTMVQQLCHNLDKNGLERTAKYMLELSTLSTDNIENTKALAYRVFIASERKGWTEEAMAYNRLVTSWPELLEKMDILKDKDVQPEQLRLEL